MIQLIASTSCISIFFKHSHNFQTHIEPHEGISCCTCHNELHCQTHWCKSHCNKAVQTYTCCHICHSCSCHQECCGNASCNNATSLCHCLPKHHYKYFYDRHCTVHLFLSNWARACSSGYDQEPGGREHRLHLHQHPQNQKRRLFESVKSWTVELRPERRKWLWVCEKK